MWYVLFKSPSTGNLLDALRGQHEDRGSAIEDAEARNARNVRFQDGLFYNIGLRYFVVPESELHLFGLEKP